MVATKWLKRPKTVNPNKIDLMNYSDSEGWNKSGNFVRMIASVSRFSFDSAKILNIAFYIRKDFSKD